MSAGTTGSAIGRGVALVVAMGAAGWASFTLYERTRLIEDAPVAAPAAPDDIAPYVDAAQSHLIAGELDDADIQLTKAGGIDEHDERVLEGLALVEVLRAERVFWQAELRPGDRRDAVERLDHDVDMARQAIATALRKIGDETVRTRLKLYERRLNTLVVVAFARVGDKERADGALHARLEGHPQRELIAAYVASSPGPGAGGGAPTQDDEAKGVLEEEEAIPPRPTRPAAGAIPQRHYELDHEPELPAPTTPGELQLPGTVD